jgi:hypothetical protein
MMVMKTLDLRDYNIEFSGMSQAIIGALIMAKVIVLMELISLGKWVQRQPPVVDVILRTLLYTLGVLIVIVLEKAFEKRHEVHGFGNAISSVIYDRDIYHVWATTIGAASSIFIYNAFSIVQRKMGKRTGQVVFRVHAAQPSDKEIIPEAHFVKQETRSFFPAASLLR